MNPQQLEMLESKSQRLSELLEDVTQSQLNAFSSLWKGFQQDEALLIN